MPKNGAKLGASSASAILDLLLATSCKEQGQQGQNGRDVGNADKQNEACGELPEADFTTSLPLKAIESIELDCCGVVCR